MVRAMPSGETTADFSQFTPGDTVVATVKRTIRNEDEEQTVTRLMRQDPDIKRRLKAGQETRMGRLHVRSRGKRPWAVREKAAKVAVPVEGTTFRTPWLPVLRKDWESVGHLLDVKKG
jgi:hypothetical protein